MKLSKRNIIISILGFILLSYSIKCQAPNDPGAQQAKNSQKLTDMPVTPSDTELTKIRDEMFKLAREQLKSPDLYKKGRASGSFSKNYNMYLRNRGKDARKKKELFPFMMDVVEVYEFCINPVLYKVNYSKWCTNQFSNKSTNSMKNLGKQNIL
jgi:hypothetical protein